MNTEYKIGIYLKSYAVDKPYEWEKRELRPIDRPSAYRVEYIVSLFLTVINNTYTLTYKTQPYDFQLLNSAKRYSKGLYILEIDTTNNSILSFEPLNQIILGGSDEMYFRNIRIEKVKAERDYFSFKRSLYHRNIELFILDGSDKSGFSSIEQNWVEYVYETAKYNTFVSNITEIFHDYIKAYKEAHNKVKGFNLQAILSDLHVEIDEIFISKVGGDDRYYVDETRTISYPTEKLDDYLREYIKIGRRNIYKDSGYTSAHSMALKGLKTGVLPAEDVSSIRENLISEYSTETHIFAIIDRLLRQYENLLEIPRLHRNDSNLDAYLMSSTFITSLERIIGGGSYIVNWDNIESLIAKANLHIKKMMWWKD